MVWITATVVFAVKLLGTRHRGGEEAGELLKLGGFITAASEPNTKLSAVKESTHGKFHQFR